ncbi:GTPase IMAP family member 4-like isoform X4 [Salvelinus alpinus]|uniref:GTPase IMAP family member 4-like isoform X4 n=1 Tax=Salvelinus alpinus TaxID=8036 RepID=UPI0039FBE331
METGENKEMETKTEDALEPSSECTCQGEEHQLFLQLEPEALDITDIESQHSDQQDDKTTKTDEEKTEITTSSNFAQSMTPVLTIALIGGTDSMEIESGNLLLGQDDLPAAELSQIAPRMYDLSGRCVSVINMLGLQSSELTQENHIGPLVHKQGINAVLLLLPLGQHIDEFKMGVGWLERMLGERALAFTIIVFTHKNDQDFGLGDLKDNNDLMDLIEMCGNRYLTCKKSMNDPIEISTLLEQIDLMVSENDLCCYTGEMYDEEIRKRQLKTDWGDRSQSEEKTASVPDNLPEDGLANKEKNPFGVDCGSPSSHHPSSRQSLSCTRAQYHQCHH